jgi:recombination protein RecT
VIYEGDVFEYGIGPDGRKKIIKHEQKLENINLAKIKGAYATVIRKDCVDVEIMTFDQIKKSWAMNKAGITPAHTNFPDQMAEKTVMNRALKLLINSSDDSSLMETGREMNTAPMPENIEVVKPPMVSAGMDQEPEKEPIQTAEVVTEPVAAKIPF